MRVKQKRRVKTTSHHAACGIEPSVRNTLEVLPAAAVVLGTVSHRAERRQQIVYCLKVRGHHGLFPGDGTRDERDLGAFREQQSEMRSRGQQQ